MIATYGDAVVTATESVVMIYFLRDKKSCIEFTLPPVGFDHHSSSSNI